MGIYFIAAGQSSKNRIKSLDKSFSLRQIQPYVPSDIKEKLKRNFDPSDDIYVWGANKGSRKNLGLVRANEYVVDVKNKDVVQVFQFCFYYFTPDTKLQEYIGWDSEKSLSERRPYRYVYFLKKPQKPFFKQKEYFARAFDQTHNQNWLVGQKYLDDQEVDMAMERAGVKQVERLLGLPK